MEKRFRMFSGAHSAKKLFDIPNTNHLLIIKERYGVKRAKLKYGIEFNIWGRILTSNRISQNPDDVDWGLFLVCFIDPDRKESKMFSCTKTDPEILKVLTINYLI